MNAFATAFQVYVAALVFARVGAMVMTMPGIGDQAIPARIRLSFALLMALILAPLVQNTVGPIPSTLGGLGGAVIHEVLIGLMIGSVLRLFMTSLTTAGEIISMQTTLSFAQSTNPSMEGSSTAVATFLSMLGLTLVMATDLHHLFIAAIVKSYTIFPFTRAVPVNDAAALAVQTVAQSFSLGVQLAAPVIVFSLVFNLATGLVGRIMPAFQIFFVASPLSVILGLSLLALSLSGIAMVWTDRYRELLDIFT
ncbi:flagellar type III secretion system protein FliR [Caulobacter vibrioides]|uniref:Flagellar biosynthetic protein FliR n=2 Tax=Caulobacter vibrioides TaxID=155892 RepID=FLIR_CAUVC|nr:flagellar biosynthetic protein FliR [Caulobacter vibrioides]YP_002516503.1 flagellar biosynthesis protein FliR [Caulobacter vibrioides NA1000]Q45975.1 RecName: Full=Flagellar biosynthetic protein FliR [Caulobacter vibrioides CB15]AAA66207.1 FliR [Caulobacter vibrioides CB15]AAK23060.1 flagellar biosynthesis protein FliR [Caulobacter vibrioides CB15]ACL94595.1 flagellar biosynthesis protein FliR [Caulobacter vibrioides NA1000]ATC24021.1 flagellar biosynthesis protein FliR [Caulobacter vibri